MDNDFIMKRNKKCWIQKVVKTFLYKNRERGEQSILLDMQQNIKNGGKMFEILSNFPHQI